MCFFSVIGLSVFTRCGFSVVGLSVFTGCGFSVFTENGFPVLGGNGVFVGGDETGDNGETVGAVILGHPHCSPYKDSKNTQI